MYEYELLDIINKQASYNELPRATAFKERLKHLVRDGSSLGFAKKCEISECVLRKYLKGDSKPMLSKLIAISRACEVPIDDSGYKRRFNRHH